MKLIKPSFEIIEDAYPINKKMDFGPLQLKDAILDNIYKHIELAGRTCYKSEDRITEDSAKAFVERMINSGHGAMLEHGTVYLMTKTKLVNYYIHPEDGECEEYNPLEKYYQNKYSYINDDDTNLYVTTNLRVLIENGWLDDLQYLCEPTKHHERRVTVRFICDRGVSHEFVRHRVFSFAQESTRYCNYSKDKFGNEITYIIPNWIDIPEGSYYQNGPVIRCKEHEWDENYKSLHTLPEFSFVESLINAEKNYFILLDKGWKPQQARAILPNSLKTELVMTGFISDWKHFFDLRCPESAHPQARELAIPLREEFIKKNYV